MEELVDVLDERGRPTGKAAAKSEAHRRGLWHRCFHCWVFGEDDGGPYLLVQRRSPRKETWPGRLDVTAAGHLMSGESTLDGLRELEEELGIVAPPERLMPLGTRRVDLPIPAGRDRELHEVFLLRDQTPPERLRLQHEEVASVLRLSLDDAEALAGGADAPATEYVEGGSQSVSVEPRDFVPYPDDYLGRVTRAVRQAFAHGWSGSA